MLRFLGLLVPPTLSGAGHHFIPHPCFGTGNFYKGKVQSTNIQIVNSVMSMLTKLCLYWQWQSDVIGR